MKRHLRVFLDLSVYFYVPKGRPHQIHDYKRSSSPTNSRFDQQCHTFFLAPKYSLDKRAAQIHLSLPVVMARTSKTSGQSCLIAKLCACGQQEKMMLAYVIWCTNRIAITKNANPDHLKFAISTPSQEFSNGFPEQHPNVIDYKNPPGLHQRTHIWTIALRII
jgi:hypothetical protein